MPRDIEKDEQAVVEFVKTYTAANGYPPTYMDIAEGIGSTMTHVRTVISRLQATGKVTIKSRIPRSIVVTAETADA